MSLGIANRAREMRSDESGVTLVELAFVLLIMAILMAVTIPIVSTVLQTSSKVNVTYSNVDEQLWLSTNLQRLIRSAVAPDPSVLDDATITPPRPAFQYGTLTATKIVFYTNTGTLNGPEKVSATCTATPSTAAQCSFKVTIAKAKGTCPFKTTTAHTCSWTTPHVLIQMPHIRNPGNHQPIFWYEVREVTPRIPRTTATRPTHTSTVTVCSTTGLPSGCTSSQKDATELGTGDCKASPSALEPFETCPAGEIEAVNYDLQINAKNTLRYGGNQAEDDTGIFTLSRTSVLFNPSVG